MDCGGCYQSEIAAGDSVAKSKCYRYYVCPRWIGCYATTLAMLAMLCFYELASLFRSALLIFIFLFLELFE